MPKASVFLTGATGTVGSAVLEALVASGGYDVCGLVRRTEQAARIEQLGARAVVGDMADGGLFDRLGAQHSFDFMIHAAQASYQDTPAPEIARRERVAVRNLEKLSGANTRLMVFTSGVWSYGTGGDGHPINESTPRRPFAAARARLELLEEIRCEARHPWAELCPPSFVYGSVGPLADLTAFFRQGGTVDVLDDASVKWSLIERLDLGRAYLALLRGGRPGELFVVAEDEAVAVIDFYEIVVAHVGHGRVARKPLVKLAAVIDANTLERKRTSQPVDASRFKQRTGWQAQESFARSAQRFLGKG